MLKRFGILALQKMSFDGMGGYCIKCGAKHRNVETDARKYKCEKCGEAKVYGAEEIVLMDLVK